MFHSVLFRRSEIVKLTIPGKKEVCNVGAALYTEVECK